MDNTERENAPNNIRNEANSETDETCCGRAIFCHRLIRNISVNQAISSCLGESSITWSTILWLLTCLSIVSVVFGTMYFLIGTPMLPGGSIFGLFWLIITSYALGWSLAYIPYLNIPPVFGMLLAGMIFRCTGYNIREEIGAGPTGKIRTFCLTFIIIRAGLQLTTTAIRNHPYFLLALALIPCTVEFFTVGLACKFILDYPWNWAFLTGTIVACMSPVVTVNCILALADKGYGEDREMATLLCTATSIDDVHIVSLFSLCYSFVFSQDERTYNWWTHMSSGLRDLGLGIIAGFLLGTVFAFFPHRNTKYVTWYRATALILGSLMFTTGASKLAVTGGGYLATLSMSFVAAQGWKLLSGINFDVMPMRQVIYFLWHFMQPVLVGIIGLEIDFGLWSLRRFGLHVLCISLGLMARSAFAILVTYGTPFTMKERIFVALAWLPKGTLQAVLAPMALEEAHKINNTNEISLAMDVISISVIAIAFLAPLGAVIMMVSGPLLLNRLDEDEINRHRELSFLRWTSLQPVYGNSNERSSTRSQA